MIDQAEILQILPQSYPFLMIDRIVEIKKGESLVAVKNITGNEWIFQNQSFQLDHLPEPFIIEAAAQAALVLYHISKIENLRIRPRYTLGVIKADLLDAWCIGDQVYITAFANKMLDTGGYSEISLCKNKKKIGLVEIFYSVEK